jgi:hypothetical protein
MLPYLPAFCNSYLHHSRVRRLRRVAPPRPCRCPRASCHHADVPTCQMRRPRRVLSTEPPSSVLRVPPAWQQAPTPWCFPGCWPAWHPFPLLHASGGLGMAKDAACTRVGEYWFGVQPPCTLGRKALVPWGEIPWDLGAQPPCTLGRKTLVPLGEVSLDLGEKPLVPTGETA